MILLEKATVPTMYFIGVTTTKSSIMKVFPEWALALGLDNTVMKGIDIPIHADPSVYRQVVEFIKNDELSMGALVTTHKIDLFNAASDLFGYLDPYATRFRELSSISKNNGILCGHAKDPISSGLAMSQFIPENYWKNHPEAGVMIMGAGGSSIAMCSYLMRSEFEGNYPSRIVIANRSQPRLNEIKRINAELTPGGIELEYHLTPEPGQNDAVMATMGTGSLIINATGLGKDRPGSPLTDSALFPELAMVWEINYRGDLLFIHQALRQKEARKLNVIDGWMYFIYGWTQVIAEVFHLDINDEVLARLDQIAAKYNNRIAS
ncbi:MAG: shikimate dehydrogenase [Planctomycetia bacterium]|nr:shikimate dehydrogenase [Planctomycetia bacterium]